MLGHEYVPIGIFALIALSFPVMTFFIGRFFRPHNDNPLKNSPHPSEDLTDTEWSHSYSQEAAVYPLASLRRNKYWPPVARVDNVHGDRNLVCSCPPLENYEEVE